VQQHLALWWCKHARCILGGQHLYRAWPIRLLENAKLMTLVNVHAMDIALGLVSGALEAKAYDILANAFEMLSSLTSISSLVE